MRLVWSGGCSRVEADDSAAALEALAPEASVAQAGAHAEAQPAGEGDEDEDEDDSRRAAATAMEAMLQEQVGRQLGQARPGGPCAALR